MTLRPSTSEVMVVRSRASIRDWHLGATIVVATCACGLPPVLLLIDVWDDHGGLVLLVLALSIAAGCAVGALLPKGYFRIRRLERYDLYRILGVVAFRRIVPEGDWIMDAARRREKIPCRIGAADLEALEARGRLAERLHVSTFVGAMPLFAVALALDRPGYAMAVLLPNLFFHAYPVMLQRFTRSRLDAARARRQRRSDVAKRAPSHRT